MTIATTAEYKVHANMSASDTSRDDQIAQALAGAEASMLRYCGVDSFSTATYTDEAYDGRNEPELLLKNWPVTAVSAVKERYGGTTVTLDSTGYVWDSRGRLMREGCGPDFAYCDVPPIMGGYSIGDVWNQGNQNYKVTYTAGYGTIPADLKQIQYEMADAILAAAGRDPTIQSESIESYSYSLQSGTERWDNWTARMSAYRRST